MTCIVGNPSFTGNDVTKNAAEKISVISDEITSSYTGKVDEQALVDGAAKGMVDALGDKYSIYYNSEEFQQIMEGIDGVYVGIGATLAQDRDGAIQVKALKKDGPAEQAGMRVNDFITRVDDMDMSGKKLADLISLIKRKDNIGKQLHIYLKRPIEGQEPENIELDVKCAEVKVDSIEYELYGEQGYIRIMKFDNETDDQFTVALSDLQKQNAKGLILDVRDNGGGALDATIAMLDELLPSGKLIKKVSKKEGEIQYTSSDQKKYDKPMVVLINENSASASEVFAGSLQARGAAQLVGKKSFGKGIVQTVKSLEKSCGGGLKLTTAEYFLPNGESIHQKGLNPDIEVEYETKEGQKYSKEKDEQLQKAVDVIREKEELFESNDNRN